MHDSARLSADMQLVQCLISCSKARLPLNWFFAVRICKLTCRTARDELSDGGRPPSRLASIRINERRDRLTDARVLAAAKKYPVRMDTEEKEKFPYSARFYSLSDATSHYTVLPHWR